MWRWGWKARAEGWRRAMQNRSWCTVAGKSKLVVSVSHTSAAFAFPVYSIPVVRPREGKATRSHAAGRWLNRDFHRNATSIKNNRSNECFCFYLSNGWLITCFPTVSFLIFTRVRHEFGADFVWRTKMFRMIFERWWRKRDEERFVKRDLKGKSGEKIVSCLFWIWFDTGYMMIRVQISFVLRVN